MTVKQGVRRLIFKKTLILLVIAAILAVFCYITSDHQSITDSNNKHMIYTLVSVGLSIVILLYIALKIRFFHDIFAKEWTGTVISAEREFIRTYRARMNLGMDDLVLVIQLDGKGRKVKLRFPYGKVGRVYVAGDKVHRLKGTRYPINLTREVEQHICPICGHNSCFGDECPNCKIKY